MPNWCQNHLTVTGATPELRAWLADGFSFQRMNPVSPPAPHHDSAIDSWRTIDTYSNAWGTKCDLDDRHEEKSAVMKIACDIFDYEDEEEPCEFAAAT